MAVRWAHLLGGPERGCRPRGSVGSCPVWPLAEGFFSVARALWLSTLPAGEGGPLPAPGVETRAGVWGNGRAREGTRSFPSAPEETEPRERDSVAWGRVRPPASSPATALGGPPRGSLGD